MKGENDGECKNLTPQQDHPIIRMLHIDSCFIKVLFSVIQKTVRRK